MAAHSLDHEVVHGRMERRPAARRIRNSILAAVGATTIALVLGSLAAFAVHRFTFFGRDTISFALVLPIALPGIVTAIALSSSIDYANSAIGLTPGLLTIIIGHATFCIVVGVQQRDRPAAAKPDVARRGVDGLGATRSQRFSHVTFPPLRTASLRERCRRSDCRSTRSS